MESRVRQAKHLLLRNLNLSSLDLFLDVLRTLAINLASDRESRAQDLQDGAFEALGHGLESHSPCNSDDLIQGNRLGVLDVLLLLSVPWWFLERLDDEGGGRWDDGDGGLTILDGESNGHAETFPVTSGFGNVFSDLLWRKTERTNLGSERG